MKNKTIENIFIYIITTVVAVLLSGGIETIAEKFIF